MELGMISSPPLSPKKYKETQMLYLKYAMRHTLEYRKFPNKPLGLYFVQTSNIRGGGLLERILIFWKGGIY